MSTAARPIESHQFTDADTGNPAGGKHLASDLEKS